MLRLWGLSGWTSCHQAETGSSALCDVTKRFCLFLSVFVFAHANLEVEQAKGHTGDSLSANVNLFFFIWTTWIIFDKILQNSCDVPLLYQIIWLFCWNYHQDVRLFLRVLFPLPQETELDILATIQNLLRQCVQPSSFLWPLSKLFSIIHHKLPRQALVSVFQVHYRPPQPHPRLPVLTSSLTSRSLLCFQTLSDLEPSLTYITDMASKVGCFFFNFLDTSSLTITLKSLSAVQFLLAQSPRFSRMLRFHPVQLWMFQQDDVPFHSFRVQQWQE